MLLLWALLHVSRADAAAHIDPRIFAGGAGVGRASFLVLLREQADLSAAPTIADRAERRRYVYETLRAHADATQTPLRNRLREARIPFRCHFLVNMVEVEADRATAEELVGRDDVSLLAPNLPAALERPGSTPAGGQAAAHESAVGLSAEPNIEKIRAPELWSLGFTGQGVVVGMADTGFQWEHLALKSHYRGWNGSTASHAYNWHDAVHDAAPENTCGSDAPAPCDDESHGTATAGLAVGDDGAGNRIGVAPGASFIGCRNMDHGDGTPVRYTECFEWLLAPTDAHGENPRPDLGADVINNSWSCPASEGCTDPEILRAVVENVRAAGIAVVVAAGNGGNRCFLISEAPSIYEASITVGATNLDDSIAGFSSFGPVTVDGSNRLKPDLTAPGVNTRTAMLGGGFTSFSGTSGSAPHVAGAFALLWSSVPALAGDVSATEEVLERGAQPLTDTVVCGNASGSDVPNPVFGWGRVDVMAAYEVATERAQPVLSRRRAGTRIVPARRP